MTTREHMKAFHTAAADHHVKMAKSHKQLAGLFGKAAGMDNSQDVSDEHTAMSKSHTEMAEHHLEMCKSVGDAMDKSAGDRMIPDAISSIPRSFPTAVPRYGQPDLSKAKVPEEFRHLVEIDEG